MSTFPDQTPQKGWWGRNWIWAVPLGCLVPFLVCCGGGLSIALFMFGTLKNSDVYTEAVARATANAEVKKEIGEPMKPDFWVAGTIQINAPGGGNANLVIPISGPKGTAVVQAIATKSNGKWEFQTLEAQTSGGNKRINLLTGSEIDKKPKALP